MCALHDRNDRLKTVALKLAQRAVDVRQPDDLISDLRESVQVCEVNLERVLTEVRHLKSSPSRLPSTR